MSVTDTSPLFFREQYTFLNEEVFDLMGLTEIKNVQNQGSWAASEIGKANNLILDVIQFSCCNRFMRVLRFLFRKKFDEQYNKLSKARDWLNAGEESLESQWELLEQYWDEESERDW